MLHRTAQERYAKLKNVFTRLKRNFNRDDLDDFMQTANSLREWIRRDPSMSPDQKAHLEKFVVPESLDWQICNQIANGNKHVGNSTPRTKKVQQPIVKVKVGDIKQGGTGFMVPPSMQTIGAGEEITIEWDDNPESGLGVAIRIFRHFHYIFEVALLPPDQRGPGALADILN